MVSGTPSAACPHRSCHELAESAKLPRNRVPYASDVESVEQFGESRVNLQPLLVETVLPTMLTAPAP
jgi:hypothetical protein